jgi:predicted permease
MRLLSRLFSRRRRYDDISVSIEEHIEERIDELTADGLTRAQAQQTARCEFGNVALIAQRSRDVWQWPLLETLLADLKFAQRRLRKSPGFAATVLLTLAIGIGANTAVFSVVNSVLLKPLPYPHSEQLVALWLNAPGAAGLANFDNGLQLSSSMYLTFSQHSNSFQSMGVWTMRYANVTGIAQPDQVNAAFVSDGVLQALNVPPTLGRWFLASDQDPRGAKTVMLNYGYWQRHFGSDSGVIGRSIQVDAQTRTIVGVMPRGFRMVDQDFDLLIPFAFDPTQQTLAGFGYAGIARLKPGVSLAQADADIAHLLPLWMDSWSNGPGSNPHYYETWRIAPNFRSLKQQVIGSVGNTLWTVMATVGLVMLIACTNLANLHLVRAESRHQELSIRAALGAGRARIARELLIESVLLGLIGGALSIGVADAGLRVLVAFGHTDLPRLSEVSLDAGSFLFTFALSVLSGLLFGSIPAWKYARAQTSAQSSIMMAGASRTASASGGEQRSRSVLVIAQVAMALVLMVSALLMIRTFSALRNVEPGFTDAAHVQTMNIWIPKLLAADPLVVARMQGEIANKLAAIPGVSSVGFAAALPMNGDDPNWDLLAVEGTSYSGGQPPLRLFNYVSPGYFPSLGTHLVAGRDFTWDDLYNLQPTVIVSENFARESWGSASAAIGKRVRKYSSSPWQLVIGVVEDMRVHGVDEKSPAIIYWPAMFYDRYTSPPVMDGLRNVAFVLHSNRTGTTSFLYQMQQAVWSVNPNLPLASVSTMQSLYSQSMARTSFTLIMLAIAGTMALALSIIGIYGVISYSVAQRTREIGIRLALGAQKSVLQRMFVRSALALTGMGVVFGLIAAAALMQLMKALLFGVSPLDPITFIVVPLVLAAAAAFASYLPARRAASVDPVVALRAE